MDGSADVRWWRAWSLRFGACVKQAPSLSSGEALTRVSRSSSWPSWSTRVTSTAAPAEWGAISGGDTYRLVAWCSCSGVQSGWAAASPSRYSVK
ncbi:hypothetical protein [Streptomyces parvulus]|uniref:hypothetical protein n=1 Tax=Streptomyces parvulus TaxID=146923 RepID=UPI003702C300